eukprot:gene25798-29144_t
MSTMLFSRLKPLASRVTVRSFAASNSFNFRQFSGSSDPAEVKLEDLIKKYKGESIGVKDAGAVADRNHTADVKSNDAKSRPRTYEFDGGEFKSDHVGEKFMAKEILPDGSKYIVASPDAHNEKHGMWVNGAFTGVWKRKIYLKENSTKHTAVCTWQIEQNEQVGMGTEEHWDGTKYEGYWQGKVRHGQGTLTTPQGHVFTGEWREGKVHSGEGSMILPWGDICHGTW